MAPKERKLYIDIARGGVILLVALGHLLPLNGLIWRWIFAFHMPFFFIMSGYCSSEENYNLSFRKYFVKYAKALLIPAVIIRLVIILAGMSPMDFSYEKWFGSMLRNLLMPGTEWFVPVLFLSKVLFYWVHRLFHLAEDIRAQKAISFFLVGLSFYVGDVLHRNGIRNVLTLFPAYPDCSLIALGFVIVGYWCRQENFEELYVKYRPQILQAGAAVTVLIFGLLYYQSYANVASMYFGNSSIAYYVFACALSFYMVALCRGAAERFRADPAVLRILALLGRNTIIVYAGHEVIHYALNKMIYWRTGILYEPSTDFKTSLIFVYFVVDIIILVPVCYFYERVRRYAKEHRQRGKIIAAAAAVLFCLLMAFRIVRAGRLAETNVTESTSAVWAEHE